MLGLLILAAASSAATIPVVYSQETQVDQICGYALEAIGLAGNENSERSRGRMESRMEEVGIPNADRPFMRSLCVVYDRGAIKGVSIASERMDAAQK